MEQQQSLWEFILQQKSKLLDQTIAHIGLTFISLLIAVLIGLPLGIFIARKRKAANMSPFFNQGEVTPLTN